MTAHDWPVVESVTEYETSWYDGGYDRVEQPDGSLKDYYWASLPPAVVVVAVDDGDVLFVDQYRPTIREQCLELVAGIVERVDERSESTDGRAARGASRERVAERSEAADGASGVSGSEVVRESRSDSRDGERASLSRTTTGGSEERRSSGEAESSGDWDESDDVAPDADRESYVAAGRRELREETGYAADDVHFVEEFWTATGLLRHRRGIVFADGLTEAEQDLDDNEFLSVERVPVEDALAVARSPPANDATIEGVLLAQADGYL